MKTSLLTFSAAVVALSALLLSGCQKEDNDSISMSDLSKGTRMIQGADGKDYEVVDLGLYSGVLWATCNMGATSPEQSGNFYSWGETQPKNYYDWSNYKWCNEDQYSFTKYCLVKERGYQEVFDNKKVLENADDAAKTLMGSNWQVPSKEDFTELLYRCELRHCKLNGVWGFMFTSKVKGYEGNSLFIPMTGRLDQSQNTFTESYGFYWANSLDNTTSAYILWLEHTEDLNNALASKSSERYLGLPIRPVLKQ